MAIDLEKYKKPQSAGTSTVDLSKYKKQAPQPEKKAMGTNIPVLKQAQDFGIGVGSTLGQAGLGLGQAAIKLGMGFNTLLNKTIGKEADNSFAQRVVDTLEKGKENIYRKPFEKNLETFSGKLGSLTGNIAPYFSGGVGQVGNMGRFSLAAARSVPDMIVAAGQSSGDAKTVGATAVTSFAANALIPKPVTSLWQTARRNIAAGAASGYIGDVATGMAGLRGEDREGINAFIPGAGTAIGTAIPVAQEAIKGAQYMHSDAYNIDKRYKALRDLESKNGKVAKAFKAGDKKGIDVRKTLSKYNLLNGAVDGDGRISSAQALDNFNEFMKPFQSEVRKALEKEGRKLSTQEIVAYADEFLAGTRVKGAARTKLEKEIAADLQSVLNGRNAAPLTDLHDIKVYRGEQNNYTDTGVQAINKEVTRFFKELVENNTRSIDVGKYNAELSKLYAIEDAITALDRAVVKGGRAGKYFASTVGSIIGGSTGNPFIAIAGAEAGNRVQQSVLRGALGGDVNAEMQPSDALLGALKTKVPQKDVIPPVVIPKSKGLGSLNLRAQSSNKAGSRNTSQATTNAIPIKAIPETVLPKAKNAKPLAGISSKGIERMEQFLDWADGTLKIKGQELIDLKGDAQLMAEHLGIDPVLSDKQLANELRKKLAEFRDVKR